MALIGDVWLTDFGDPFPGEPAFRRPAVMLGPGEVFGTGFPFRLVAPLTTTRRGLDLHIEIEPSTSTGLSDVSYVQPELLRALNARRLVARMGVLDPQDLRKVREVVARLLSLDARSA